MDLTGLLTLAYLEEDDTRRVLFRVRPLLTTGGSITPEDVEEFGQEGYLRIAPDRMEQYTFKERMRSLGSLCLINLLGAEAALGKVRPNKNYAPGKNEPNRYIIYSNAIEALPEGLVYEVVSEDKSEKSLTSQYYLRSGGRISGPYCKSGALSCPASHTLMPDNDRLFLVEMPDKTSRMFYWPQEENRGMNEPAVPEVRPLADLLTEVPDTAEDMNPGKELDLAEENVTEAEAREIEDEAEAEEEDQHRDLPRFEEAAAEFSGVLSAYGFVMDETSARQALMLLITSEKVQLVCDSMADAALAKDILKDLLPSSARPKLLRADSLTANDRGRFNKKPWPMLRLMSGNDIPVYIDIEPLDEDALLPFLYVDEDELDSVSFISRLLNEAREEGKPIPLRLRRMMVDYLLPLGHISGVPEDARYPFIFAAFVEPWLVNLDPNG